MNIGEQVAAVMPGANCSILSADVGQKNLLVVFESVICEQLNQPSRILPHLDTLIPLSTFSLPR